MRNPFDGVRPSLQECRDEEEAAPAHQNRRGRQLRARAEIHERLPMDSERHGRARDGDPAAAEGQTVLE